MTSVDFSLLGKKLKSSKVLVPSDGDEFLTSLSRWSKTAEKKAAAVVIIQSDEDVSTAVKFAAQHDIPIAVRGGGHSCSGSSSVVNGLVIDLSRKRAVVVDAVAKTATVEGGALWEDVDKETAKYGLACVAGTGGLSLGGGYGWLSGRHGLVVDNTLWVRMVLADGRIVTASKDENPDLFWAVRGAGASFGVALEFCFKAHPIPEHCCSGVLIFPIEKLDAGIDLTNHFYENLLDADCGFVFILAEPLPHKVPIFAIAAVLFDSTLAQAQEKLAKFIALGPTLNTLREIPFEEVNTIFNKGLDHGSRRLVHGSSVQAPLNRALIHDAQKSLSKFISDVDKANETLIMMEIFPLDKICEVPLTDTAVVMRTKSVNACVSSTWEDPANDMAIRDWARNMCKKMNDVGNPNSAFTQYPNLSNAESRSRNLFGVNYDRLVQLKQKYDASNMFKSWHDLSGTCDNKLFGP